MKTISYIAGGSVIVDATQADKAAQAARQARYWMIFLEEYDTAWQAAIFGVFPEPLRTVASKVRDECVDAAKRAAMARMDDVGLRVDPLPPPQKSSPGLKFKSRFTLDRPAIASQADAAAFASKLVDAVRQ